MGLISHRFSLFSFNLIAGIDCQETYVKSKTKRYIHGTFILNANCHKNMLSEIIISFYKSFFAVSYSPFCVHPFQFTAINSNQLLKIFAMLINKVNLILIQNWTCDGSQSQICNSTVQNKPLEFLKCNYVQIAIKVSVWKCIVINVYES